jgi:porin
MDRCLTAAALTALLCGMAAPLTRAQSKDPDAPPPSNAILPLPDYSGDLFNRSHLAGDPGGLRSQLASKGLQLQADWVQTAQSVVDGGRETGSKYGGSMDYLILADLYRMGLVPGGLIKVRAETRYGESVNSISGSILPVNADGFFPLHAPLDDCIPITVTDLTYYQFLSEQFGLIAGKLDTLDSDMNEFASGRGNTQFMNMNFFVSPTVAIMPYSTVGGGVIIMPSKYVQITSLVIDLNDSSTTTGLSDWGSHWAWASEGDFQYRLGKLPGGTNVGAIYAWNADFFNFGNRFVFQRGEGLVAPRKSDTWLVYASGWQYLHTRTQTDAPINLLNAEPDLEGFGVFWRASLADDEVNPTEWSLSGGVGGKGMIPGREKDYYGAGYYYNSVQAGRLASALKFDDHVQGFECFYNIALTPAAHLTLDAQVIDSAQSTLDTAWILGMRLKLDF